MPWGWGWVWGSAHTGVPEEGFRDCDLRWFQVVPPCEQPRVTGRIPMVGIWRQFCVAACEGISSYKVRGSRDGLLVNEERPGQVLKIVPFHVLPVQLTCTQKWFLFFPVRGYRDVPGYWHFAWRLSAGCRIGLCGESSFIRHLSLYIRRLPSSPWPSSIPLLSSFYRCTWKGLRDIRVAVQAS